MSQDEGYEILKERLTRYLEYWSRIASSTFDVPLKLEAWLRVEEAKEKLEALQCNQPQK